MFYTNLFLRFGVKIFNIVTTGASNANETINDKTYDEITCPKNMITIESVPKCNGESVFNANKRITNGCTRYAQYVTRENGYIQVADNKLFT